MILALTAAIAGPAIASIAVSGDSGRAPINGHHRAPTHLPDYILDLNALNIEHWPSNYIPNTYNLPAYQNEYSAPQNCRGKTGESLSTASRPCPSGQQKTSSGRRLSTAPPARTK